MYFASIASLVAQPFPIPSTEFIVGGFYKPGDGGGGTFMWYEPPLGTTWPAQDLGIIFYSPNDSDGYFQRIYSGPVNVRWFGAIYDEDAGRIDLTHYVHAARNSEAFANDGTIYFPKGVYPGAFEFTHQGPERSEINILSLPCLPHGDTAASRR
ncbi:MAG TPA: hypothetical protein VEB40_07585 [Flavipsychrobacter sp.]|nr:hypothetical protein [Flavipsychrobacter sp.]